MRWTVLDGRPHGELRLDGGTLSPERPLRLEGAPRLEIIGPGRLVAVIEGTPEALVVLQNCAVVELYPGPVP